MRLSRGHPDQTERAKETAVKEPDSARTVPMLQRARPEGLRLGHGQSLAEDVGPLIEYLRLTRWCGHERSPCFGVETSRMIAIRPSRQLLEPSRLPPNPLEKPPPVSPPVLLITDLVASLWIWGFSGPGCPGLLPSVSPYSTRTWSPSSRPHT